MFVVFFFRGWGVGFWDKVSLYSPGWPTAYCVDQAGLPTQRSTSLLLPSAGIKGVASHRVILYTVLLLKHHYFKWKARARGNVCKCSLTSMSSSELRVQEKWWSVSKCGDSFWGIWTNELGKTDKCSLLVRSHLALGVSCQWSLSKRRLLPGALPKTYLTCPVFLCLTICSSRNQEGWGWSWRIWLRGSAHQGVGKEPWKGRVKLMLMVRVRSTKDTKETNWTS